MIVGLDHFRPKAVTVQDREAGLCTMTQYPTQAAQMVSGYCISELPSQPKVPTDSLKQNPGKSL